MSLLPILTFPDTALRQMAEKITAFDSDLTTLITDMVETMYDAPGVGLAAPQIGKSLRLIVVDISKKDEEHMSMVMVNPEITSSEGKQVDEEGCLSVLDLTASVKRSMKITVAYQDAEGNMQEITTDDRFAIILQHEIDHLNGILFLDHLSTLKRSLYKKKIKKQLAAAQKKLGAK
ncbi:MAG: peptide deformylase [Desulfocapsa sp.]|nr:MAG: peptide deformylase [Desulfocapsa sp.]